MRDVDLDVAAYLARVGLAALPAPTVDGVATLLEAHVGAIPFENLDVLAGRGVELAPAVVQDKLVTRRRGGYCFEHVTLFAAALEAMAVPFDRLAARVLIRAVQYPPPRTHAVLRLYLEGGTWLVDPGFGGLAARRPKRLAEGDPSRSVDGVHRLVRDAEGGWLLQIEQDQTWTDLYAFTLEVQEPVDYVVANHFTATHPGSRFRRGLVVQRKTPTGARSLLDFELRERDGEVVSVTRIPDRAALRVVLAERFGIEAPEVESLVVPGLAAWS
jgi:N-hydroxyarylamine O-acetyltransferase